MSGKDADVRNQLTPTLALVLSHDLLLSKRGVALPAKHGLHATISRHQTRLKAELTKWRTRNGFPTLEALREDVNRKANEGNESNGRPVHPRWIRVNTLRTTLDEQLASTFKDFERVATVTDVARSGGRKLYLDEDVRNLVAVSPSVNLTTSSAYREGKLIFQDKASCFPAYLLNPTEDDGDVIDATAAPGNKTTHLAAILRERGGTGKVFACEKDELRSKTLEKMTKLADPEGVIVVKGKQDFTKLDPKSKGFENVTAILLDPSCSGSGIVGRDEGGVTVHLPSTEAAEPAKTNGKKRKRAAGKPVAEAAESVPETPALDEETQDEPQRIGSTALRERLIALSDFQLRMVKHAMKFPSARRITYSTCSLHGKENEDVVVQALLSDAAGEGGWRIMRRDEQVEGMQRWPKRGILAAVKTFIHDCVPVDDLGAEEVAEACIRCDKSSEDGTMGFFVAGFVKDAEEVKRRYKGPLRREANELGGLSEEEEWGGFDSD